MKARTYKPWDAEDVQFLKDNFMTLPRSELAEKLGRTEHSIIGKARKLGISISPLDIQFIHSLNCFAAIEVAERTKRSLCTVHEWCRVGKIEGAFKVMAPSGNVMWAIPFPDLARLPNETDTKYLFGELPPINTADSERVRDEVRSGHIFTVRSFANDAVFRKIFRLLNIPEQMAEVVSEITVERE